MVNPSEATISMAPVRDSDSMEIRVRIDNDFPLTMTVTKLQGPNERAAFGRYLGTAVAAFFSQREMRLGG
jgi:hypothetical protein